MLSIGILLVGQMVMAQAYFSGVRNQYQSIRALGMGGASVALSDDFNTLMMNPAGLARLESWQVNLSTEAALADDVFQFTQALSNVTNANGTAEENLNQMLEFLSSQFGKTQYFRTVPMAGIYARPGFGVGFIPLDVEVTLGVNQSVSPQLSVLNYNDTTAVMGFARDTDLLKSGRLSWGLTGKVVHRTMISQSFTALDLAADSNLFATNSMAEGMTFDGDFGLLYTPSVPKEGFLSFLHYARPTFGLVVRNVLDMGFSTDLDLVQPGPNAQPDRLYRRIDIGSTWDYPELWIFKARGLLDFRNMGDPNWSFRKGLHIGAEVDWKLSNWWKGAYRLGLNQGYFTFGFSAKLGITNLDLVTWGEEMGTDKNPIASRRYMLRMNIEI